VDVAHSAAQARTLDWDQYQAIVLDILMEDETGIELLTERLATLGESRIPPTLLYTAMPLDYVPVPAGGWPKCVTLRQKDGSIKELLQTLETMIHETIDCSP
jgi:CheY-like chemotaxis protein